MQAASEARAEEVTEKVKEVIARLDVPNIDVDKVIIGLIWA